jgi:hypothetical protein
MASENIITPEAIKTYEAKFRASIWAKVVELSADSTAHGYHNIYKTNKILVRIMYAFFFSCSTCFCSYLVVSGILKFLEYDVTSEIRLMYPEEGSIRFPMVT